MHGDCLVLVWDRVIAAYGGADGEVRDGARLLLWVRNGLRPPPAHLQAREDVAEERARRRGHLAVDQGQHADVPQVREQHREERRLQVRVHCPLIAAGAPH